MHDSGAWLVGAHLPTVATLTEGPSEAALATRERFGAWCQPITVPCLDVAPVLQEAQAAGTPVVQDGHWHPEAHRYTARVLGRILGPALDQAAHR